MGGRVNTSFMLIVLAPSDNNELAKDLVVLAAPQLL